MKKSLGLFSLLIATFPLCALGQSREALSLHYDKPAEYFEEALVLGNGTLGATVYGGVGEERVSLNDLTLWTGEPCAQKVYSPEAWRSLEGIREALSHEDYALADRLNRALQGEYTQNYQPLGNLLLTDLNIKGQKDEGQGYSRTLNLPTATAQVQYGQVQRQYFVSAPDSVLVIRLRAKTGHRLNERIGFSSLLPIQKKCVEQEQCADLIVSGYTAYASSPSYSN